MSESLTFEDVRRARAVVAALVREEGPTSDLFGPLVEAKRQLGIVISLRWPERLDEVLEEQG